jgi:hypothetical protein
MPLVGPSLAIFVISVLMMVFSTVAVLLRTFVRLYILQSFGFDDAFMLLALVGYLWIRQGYLFADYLVGFLRGIECLLFYGDSERCWPLKDGLYKHGGL